jgi:hypothetical protein
MSSTQFLQDRERGKDGQHYVVEMLRSWGVTVYEVEDGMFPDWDLQYFDKDNQPHTIEVKHDFRAKDTGNFSLNLRLYSTPKQNSSQLLLMIPGQSISLHFSRY